MTSIGIKKTLHASYDEVLERIPEALATEGFGVLTEIDVQHTLKSKIDVDFRRYKIIGACNPKLAYQALQAELDVGLMLPCNVVVYENDDGTAVVTAIDPMQTVAAHGDDRLREIASIVRDKLENALDRIEVRS
jgi:uncharacterized protein (DUF302 family)